MTMARRECSYDAEKLSPRQKNGSSDAEKLCPRRKNGSSDAEIGISGQKTCSSDAEIGISGQKACSSDAVKHRPRLRTRIYATEIGIRPIAGTLNSYNFEKNFSIILSEATTKTSGRSSTSKLQENYFRKF
ncbi:MAG: hypothetical protein IJW29_09030 [Clostridia bacterium]|nr:hypothetical protein [Clostridia bacterium]